MVGAAVRVCGWAHAVPGIGADDGPEPAFVLRDHTGTVDVVAPTGTLAEEVRALTAESAVEVSATVRAPGAATAATAPVALALRRLRVLGRAEEQLPLPAGASLDARLDWRHLDLRTPRNRLIFEVQTTVEQAMREWWHRHDFLELHSPKFRATPNMSGRELFTVDYFDRRAYLAQSPQFYKQMAMCAGLDRVFEIGPVFRANPLVTPRHDTEFVSVDVEISWIESHEEVMALEERWLRHVVAAVERAHGPEVRRRFGRPITVPDVPFPRIPLAEARLMLAADGHAAEADGDDIDAAGERLLAAHVAAALGHELVFVTDYPAALRPFYHMRLDDGSALTRSFDLLWNGLEVTTGAQREHRHDRLVAQAGADPTRVDVVRPYLDFFRHGCPPHGGFGLGLSRLLVCLLGVDDVRETTFLPRDRHRLTP
jgi:aspartyl-tRNA synthetase